MDLNIFAVFFLLGGGYEFLFAALWPGREKMARRTIRTEEMTIRILLYILEK